MLLYKIKGLIWESIMHIVSSVHSRPKKKERVNGNQKVLPEGQQH